MRIKLTPDRGLRVEKTRLNGVPTLILCPAEREPANVGLMWIHGGGFITGMKEMVYKSRAADLVKQYGVTVYAPGYRLASALFATGSSHSSTDISSPTKRMPSLFSLTLYLSEQ